MAQTSRAKRKLRRLKRANTLAYRLLDIVVKERDLFRNIVITARNQAMQELIDKSKEEPKTDQPLEAGIEPTENIGYSQPEEISE